MAYRTGILKVSLGVGAFLSLSLAGASQAVETVVRFELVAGSASVEAKVRLIPRVARGQEAPPVRETQVAVPGQLVEDLPLGQVWEAAVEAGGYWAEPAEVEPRQGPGSTRILLFPTTKVLGTISAPQATEPVKVVEIHFEPPPTAFSSHPKGAVSCPVLEGRLACHLPVGTYDLRIRRAGSSQEYRWNVPIEPGKPFDLGRLELLLGSSVVGWVEATDAGPPLTGCEVTLAPEQAGEVPDLETEKRLRAASLKISTNDRGFFQFRGVPPGIYSLHATHPDWADAWLAPIEVEPGLESRLTEPIRLGKPVTFELSLSPPLDPFGRPWWVELFVGGRRGESRQNRLRGAAGSDGLFTRRNLAPGEYLLHVEDEDQARWDSRRIEVTAEDPREEIALPVLEVRGTLSRGEDPISGTLWFGGRFGSRKVRMAADLDGKFAGFLPGEGSWDVELERPGSERDGILLAPVEIHPRKGKSYAEVELKIPDTTLSGEVVDELGHSVAAAEVSAVPARPEGRPSSATSDGDGRFQMDGLPAGEVFVFARLGERDSERALVFLQERLETTSLRLVLRSLRELTGTLHGPAGSVAGARILALPDLGASGGASLVQAMSGPDGGFRLRLPAAVPGASLVVEAPGHGVRLLHIDTGANPLDIELDAHGGLLTLDLSGLAVPGGRRSAPFLIHDGAAIPAPLLARLSGSPPANQGVVNLSNFETGSYFLCVGRSGTTAAAESDASAPGCSGGLLLPGGQLNLSYPAPPPPGASAGN